jgi:hypothetical protein
MAGKERAMPTYSQGPRLLKGAIVAIDPATSGRSTIVFQYNPETVKRSLEPQMAGARPSAVGTQIAGSIYSRLVGSRPLPGLLERSPV